MYFCWKNVSSFCKCKSFSHFLSKNISVYAIFNDQSFNDTLTNDIVSFEQLGPVVLGYAVFIWGISSEKFQNVQNAQIQIILYMCSITLVLTIHSCSL